MGRLGNIAAICLLAMYVGICRMLLLDVHRGVFTNLEATGLFVMITGIFAYWIILIIKLNKPE